jgi:hypothetical protein
MRIAHVIMGACAMLLSACRTTPPLRNSAILDTKHP